MISWALQHVATPTPVLRLTDRDTWSIGDWHVLHTQSSLFASWFSFAQYVLVMIVAVFVVSPRRQRWYSCPKKWLIEKQFVFGLYSSIAFITIWRLALEAVRFRVRLMRNRRRLDSASWLLSIFHWTGEKNRVSRSLELMASFGLSLSLSPVILRPARIGQMQNV